MALVCISPKPHISKAVIDGMRQYINIIIENIFRCKSKEENNIFCTDYPLERECITFRRDVNTDKRITLHTIADGQIQIRHSRYSTNDGYLIVNTEEKTIHIDFKNELVKNECTKEDEDVNIFMYAIGKCTESCIESIMETLFERDNRFMLEHTGGISISSLRTLSSSNESTKIVGRQNSAVIFNQAEFISEIIRGALFVDQISKSIRSIVKPNEDMKLAMRQTFAAALVHTGLVRVAHSFSIRNTTEIPQNLTAIMKECVKLYPVLARAKQSKIVSGSLKHRYNDFLSEISKKADCIINQEPSKKPFNEALSETIRFIGSSLPINEVHVLIDIKRERELIRENGLSFLELILSNNLRKDLKESFLQAIDYSEYIEKFKELISASSILHSIRIFGDINVEEIISIIESEHHENFFWEVIEEKINLKNEAVINFILKEIKRGNHKAQNIVVNNYERFAGFDMNPKEVKSIYDLKIIIKNAEKDPTVIQKYGFTPENIIKQMSTYVLLEEDDPEFFYVQWYEEVIKFVCRTELIQEYKDAAWKELIDENTEYLLGTLWLISQFESYFLSPEESNIVYSIFNQLTESNNLKKEEAVKLKLSIDTLSVCLRSESNYTQFRSCCDVRKLFETLIITKGENLYNITPSPVIPDGSWIALRGGSTVGNMIESVSNDICVFVGPSINKPSEKIFHKFGIKGSTETAEFGFITAEGKAFGFDILSKVAFTDGFLCGYMSSGDGIFVGSKNAVFGKPEIDTNSSFPMFPFIITFNETTQITAEITQEETITTTAKITQEGLSPKFDPCFPICVGSKVVIKGEFRQAIVLETREGNDGIDVVAIGNGLPPEAMTVSASKCERVQESMQMVINRFLKITGCDLVNNEIGINSLRMYAKKKLFDQIIDASVSISLPLIIQELKKICSNVNVIKHPEGIQEFIRKYGRHIYKYDSFIFEASLVSEDSLKVFINNFDFSLRALLFHKFRFDIECNQMIISRFRNELTIEQLCHIFKKLFVAGWYIVMQEKIEESIRKGNFANEIGYISYEMCNYTRAISFAPSLSYKKLLMLGFIDKIQYAPNCNLAISKKLYNHDLINQEASNLLMALNMAEPLISKEIEEACCKVYQGVAFEEEWENEDIKNAFNLRKSMLDRCEYYFPDKLMDNIISMIYDNQKNRSNTNFRINRFDALLFEKSNGKEGQSMLQQLIKQKIKISQIGNRFSFHFMNEGSIDFGGPTREALTMLSKEILGFCEYSDDGYFFRSDTPLDIVDAAGIVIALALFKRETISLALADSYWKALVSTELPSDPILASIYRGFGSCIFGPYRAILDWKGVRDDVTGLASLSGAELIPKINGIEHCPELKDVIANFDPIDTRRLLRFVTGSKTIRNDVDAFRVNTYDLKVGTPPKNAFIPVAHTCFRSLDVYRTNDSSIMEEKLRLAMDAILISDNRENLNGFGELM